jgi:hypothetical protein
MRLEKKSPCKVNLLLNILGRRADGFHELETVMHPVNLCDEMTFARAGTGLELTCSHPELPVDGKNLVHRAATAFLAAANITDGVRIHLQKNLPLAGGIGGGSANAAVTFTALNELFGSPCRRPNSTPSPPRSARTFPFFCRTSRRSPPAAASGCSDWSSFQHCAARRFSSPIPALAFPRRGRTKTSRGFRKP